MFDQLADRFNRTLKNLRGQGRLTEDNIQDTLREIRKALLEADVALAAITSFIDQIRERALGQEVQQSLTPGQALVKIVHEALIAVMGDATAELNFNCPPPAVILMAGLQGSGKTTSVGKLARLLKEKHKKSVMVTSCDVYRPAAIQQLATLANDLGVALHPSTSQQKPVDIAKAALEAARKQFIDVILIDTAGRLHIDDQMMDEIQQLHRATQPIETLFVVDSMTGQDAANTAKAFNDALPLTGVILTKIDGDARGGAALSIRQLTGKPIKFLGVGEKLDALEPFHPERIASRILGMGDVLGLIETIEEKVDQKKTEKLAKKIKKGKGLSLEDFRDQLLQMQNMGGLASLMDKLPGMGQIPEAAKAQISNQNFTPQIAIINSMTPKERQFPQLIKGSRKRRIAGGSGTQVQDVNRLLKQFTQMQKTMKKMGKKGLSKLMGGMPPGGPGQLF